MGPLFLGDLVEVASLLPRVFSFGARYHRGKLTVKKVSLALWSINHKLQGNTLPC